MAFDLTLSQKVPMSGQPPKTEWGTAVNTNSAELWELADPWIDWVPTYSNITVGNGAVVARRHQVADLTVIAFALTFGTTTTIDALFPQVGPGISANWGVSGEAAFYDSSAGQWHTGGVNAEVGTGLFAFSSEADQFVLDASTPFVWGTGDILSFTVYGSTEYSGKVST